MLHSVGQKDVQKFESQWLSNQWRTWSANIRGGTAGNLKSYPVPESDS